LLLAPMLEFGRHVLLTSLSRLRFVIASGRRAKRTVSMLCRVWFFAADARAISVMRLHVTLVLFKLARFSSLLFSSLLIRPATGMCSLRATCRSDWMMFIRHSWVLRNRNGRASPRV
jgi:hypothetical protein